MPTSPLRLGLLAVVLGACASQHSSQLDGPVDYQIQNNFIRSETTVHLELDGSAQKRITNGTGPTKMTSGTVDAAMLDALRADIAAVDLASLRADYSCADHVCATDAPVVTLTIAADGTTTQIRVDRGISNSDLPAGLVEIISDLDAITNQLP